MSALDPFLHILTILSDNYLTIPAFLDSIMQGHHSTDHLRNEVFQWAFSLVTHQLQKEIATLSQRRHGLHFNTKHAESSYMETSFMQEAARKMESTTPWLWKLVREFLNAKGSNSQWTQSGVEDLCEGDELQDGQNAGGSDGDMSSEDQQSQQESTESNRQRKRRKTAERAGARKAALMVIKSVTCISIFLHSTNRRCNYLQSILGIFYHSALVPEKVIEMLSHAGLSVAPTSINSAIKSLSKEAGDRLRKSAQTLTMAFAYDNFDMSFKVAEPTVERDSSFISATSATAIPLVAIKEPEDLRCSKQLWERDPKNPTAIDPIINDENLLERFYQRGEHTLEGNELSPIMLRLTWHIRNILINQVGAFAKYKGQLGAPKPVNPIPVHRTQQLPCRAMNIKESTPDGNMQVMEDLLRQGGLGEPTNKSFNAEAGDIDISDFVLLVHGDLLTKERLDSVKRTRRVEDTPKRRFQYVVFLPGLFHFEMACADALWRTWVQPNAARKDPNSMFHHAGILRPNESGKFGTKPGYQRMHHVIQHDIWAAMLDCWGIEARCENAAWTSLEEFAKADPSWDLIVEMSNRIGQKYVGTALKVSILRRDAARDQIFENQVLRNRDELFYLELHHAIKSGDIGRVEDTFMHWIFMFKATGKHKYAHHMLQTMLNLEDLYPPKLANIIRMNWLCNPGGKVDGFRGVDWLVERNNLYTKVIYGGSGPNRTLKRILDESILIEFYRSCQVTIENGFHLEHRTIRHSPPDMTKTLQKLSREFGKCNPHVFTPERRAQYEAPDQIYMGLNKVQMSGIMERDDDSRIGVIEGEPMNASEMEVVPEDELDGHELLLEDNTWGNTGEFWVDVGAEDLEVE